MNRYKDILKQEKAMEEALAALKQDIVTAVRAGKVDGVTEHEGDSPRSCTVNFSTIAKNNLSLSAKTYSQQSQADAVIRRLAGAKRISDVLERLDDMVSSGRINFANGDSVTLNEATVSALKEFCPD